MTPSTSATPSTTDSPSTPSTTTPSTTATDSPRPTRWGDREGRRRDILDAARLQMQGGGYVELNMRDIARGAGVSPGTLYQYFSTKEEIFATLYDEAIEAHTARLAPICEAAEDLEAFLVEVATAYLDLYAAYGQYFTTWSAVMAESAPDDAPLPRELSLHLRAVTYEQAVLVVTTMRRIAEGRGHRLVDEPQAMPMLWAVLNGLADHVTSERHKLTRFSIEELIAFAARTLAAGLVTRT
ncbi:MAG: TetR/AcrR family transcriptional regulator [Acidimicrobiales bacterium]